MGLGATLRTISQAVACVEKWAAVLLILVMTTAVTMQVFWRFVLASPLAWTEEAARLAMIWMVFMVVGWAIGNRTHIAADFVVQKLPVHAQRWVRVVTTATIAAFSLLLLVTGARLVILQSVAANTPIGLPRSVFSLQVPVSAFFVLIHTLDLLCQDLAGNGVSPGSAGTEARP
jgi:TRAP-type C4-dicarboxylate transport system permease small subunit